MAVIDFWYSIGSTSGSIASVWPSDDNFRSSLISGHSQVRGHILRGPIGSVHIHDTHAPVAKPPTASEADMDQRFALLKKPSRRHLPHDSPAFLRPST